MYKHSTAVQPQGSSVFDLPIDHLDVLFAKDTVTVCNRLAVLGGERVSHAKGIVTKVV
jgi:hypothetical protein